jgi:cell division protein FtsB
MSGDRVRVRAWVLWAGPVVSLLAAGSTVVLDREAGLFALLDLRDRVVDAESHLLTLAEERRDLARQVAGLRTDPFYVEMAAREVLGMVAPGEVVIRFRSAREG